MNTHPRQRAARLPCWTGAVDPQPVSGGITNANFRVHDEGADYFVRIGDDLPVHGVLRFNETAASRAAHAAGISPEVVHCEPGALVLRFIDGRTLTPEDVRKPEILERIVPLVKACHHELPRHLRGPTLAFWVFHVIRDYAHTLGAGTSPIQADLPRLLAVASDLEKAVGPVDLVFCHNDLLAGNFLDDGDRLWLVDWDYAGWGSALFDLGGLASNSAVAPELEEWMLERYLERPVDDSLGRRYRAMKCASLLRESLWSAVSELHSSIDFDYAGYTQENLTRFEAAWTDLRAR